MASKFKKNTNFNRKPGKDGFKNHKKKGQVFREKPKAGLLEDKEISTIQSQYDSIDPAKIITFNDFPLSRKTRQGLQRSKYIKPTEIQKQSIGFALRGRDVLGAAVTGSGKTLAFLIPVMENLFLKKWTRQDGVGAIIISPTRELAYQIFETLKKVGSTHDFSAGLIIGGKDVEEERSRVHQCNIIICTPGRLLHHLDADQLLNCATMQILVLDEADRCLDMGFENTMNAIIEHLPPTRQTLLFSATQTKSVKDLARLSLTNPQYVAPHEQSIYSTPEALQQNYIVIELEEKLTMLWSFIKNHLKQKIIVFLSSCKQVKYFGEILKKLRPGTNVLSLYGTLKQYRRVDIYNEFCRKSNAVLLATDIASRGLDFPVVNWVIQLDCPEDGTAYIHRAGRTARHTARGESLLVLLPSEEEGMVEELKKHKIPINKIQIDPKRMFSPRAKIESFLAQSGELKASAQRAFIAYVKSVFLMSNKNIFKVDELTTDAFATSLGLIEPPRIRFLQRLRKTKDKKKKETNDNGEVESDAEESNDDEEASGESDDEGTSVQKRKSTTSDHIKFADSSDSDDDEDDGLIQIKRRDHELSGDDDDDSNENSAQIEDGKSKSTKVITKAALAKKIIKKKIQANKKVVFDDDGAEVAGINTLKSELAKEYEGGSDSGGIDIEKAKQLIQAEDEFDKERFKSLVKARRKLKKKKNQKDSAEQDDFGSDEESDGPDLSWLPDPDKLKRNGADDDVSDSDEGEMQRRVVNSSDESSDDSSDEYQKPTLSSRQKSKLPAERQQKNKRNQNDDDDDNDDNDDDDNNDDDDEDEEDNVPPPSKIRKITAKLSLNETEQFAMQLLNG